MNNSLENGGEFLPFVPLAGRRRIVINFPELFFVDV